MNACAITALALALLWASACPAQSVAPARVQWQKTFGGDSADRLPCLARTADGGFLLGAHSWSGVSGNKSTPNYGEYDFWVLRLDSRGDKVWEANFGGTGNDLLWALQPTADGGCVLVGESWSSGPSDFWIVRLNANGHKLWDKTFGGRYVDSARSVIQTPDGGFLVAGSSDSDADGNKTNPNLGLNDFWVVRLNAQGEKLWDRAYGGLQDDYLTDAQQTADQGFILAGYSNSAQDGNKSAANYGGHDLWLVRIDADGNKLWDLAYGGAAEDRDSRVLQTADGGFLLGGSTMSGVSGTKSSPFYGLYGDYWILRLNADGEKLWEQDFGGTATDRLSDVAQTPDGGFMVAGSSSSGADGNKTAHRLSYHDAWLVRLDQAGVRIWDQTYTGLTNVGQPRLQHTLDGGFMMAVQQGDFTEPRTIDLALIKLSADALTAPQLRLPTLSAGNAFRFQLSGIANRTYVTEFSSDLRNWTPLATNLGGPVDVVDPAPAAGKRFYRARMVE